MFSYGTRHQGSRFPAPEIAIHASTREAPERVVQIPAILDTGATRTGLPRLAIEQLAPQISTMKYFRGAGQKHAEPVRLYVIDLLVGECSFVSHEVVPLESTYAVVARDILNSYAIQFDAPGMTWTVLRKSEKPLL